MHIAMYKINAYAAFLLLSLVKNDNNKDHLKPVGTLEAGWLFGVDCKKRILNARFGAIGVAAFNLKGPNQ